MAMYFEAFQNTGKEIKTGGGESWLIEKSYGENSSGWHPYE